MAAGTDGNDYKKIHVTSSSSKDHETTQAATQEEEVIYVGPSTVGEEHAPDAPATASASDLSAALQADTKLETAAAPAEDDAQQPEPAADGTRTSAKRSDGGWHEQTLEEIDNVDVPFKNGQKAVIIALAVFVAAVVAYLIFFR